MYIPQSKKIPPLFPFYFGKNLDSNNRWLALSGIIPWDKLDELYSKYFSQDAGRPAKDSRLIAGLLIIKQIKNCSDEDVIQEFVENPYVQAFCGREYFMIEEPINQNILSERRKRLGRDFFDFLETEVAKILLNQKLVRFKPSKNSRKDNILLSILNKVKEICSIKN
jgi:IS5 family transposase